MAHIITEVKNGNIILLIPDPFKYDCNKCINIGTAKCGYCLEEQEKARKNKEAILSSLKKYTVIYEYKKPK